MLSLQSYSNTVDKKSQYVFPVFYTNQKGKPHIRKIKNGTFAMNVPFYVYGLSKIT